MRLLFAGGGFSARAAADNFVVRIEGCDGKHYRADCPNGPAAAIRARHSDYNIC
jgi:hypothetical protein